MIQAKRAYVKAGEKARYWPKYLLLGVGFYLIWTLARGVFQLRAAYQRIDDARRVLALEQARSEQLRKKWDEVQTAEYLEEVARNDLNMQKEGETIVVLPSNKPAFVMDSGEAKEEKELPNYLKWWNLVK